MQTRVHWVVGSVVLVAMLALHAGAVAAAEPPEAPLPHPLDGPKTVALPATVDSVTPAGGGRYLLLRIDKLAKLAVFDVAADRIKGYIPLGSGDTLVAAGADKVVLVARDKNVVQRWNIEPLEKELTVALVVAQVDGVAMGHASQGPVLVMTRTGPQFLSLQTLKAADYSFEGQNGGGSWSSHSDRGIAAVASADGQSFAGYQRGVSPAGVRLMRLQGNSIVTRYEHDGAGSLVPTWDGSLLLTNQGIYSADLKPVSADQFRQKACIPAYRPGYFLTFTWPDQNRNPNPGGVAKGGTAVSVYTSSDRALLVTLPPMPEVSALREAYAGGAPQTLEWHERVFLVPQHQRLVTVSDTRDSLVVRPFDMMAALEKAGIDYLFVDSLPVTTADPGKAYRYPITVQSKKGGIKFTLDSGPQGMTLSNDGVLSWQVPAVFDPGPAGVIVTIEDSAGQSLFHTFNVQVSESASRPGGATAKKIQLGPESNQYNGSGRGAPPIVRAVKKPAKGPSSAKTE